MGGGGQGTGQHLTLTVLMEELQDGRLLGVEEECGHVIVGIIGTEKCLDGRIHIF